MAAPGGGGGVTPTFGPRGGGTPEIAVEGKMEQGFHSGGPAIRPKDICKQFVIRNCPHSISGKTQVDGNMGKFDHPTRCQKLLIYCQRQRFGCY